MQRCFFALILLVVISPLTSAEAYTIQGKATYGDNTPVILQNIYVNCENGDLDCYPFKGSKAITESQGVYSLTLQVEPERNGTTILLSLLGENFPHTINLDQTDANGERIVRFDIKLEQTPVSSGTFAGFGCCLVLFGVIFLSALLKTGRRLSTPQGRLEFMGYRPIRMLTCPKCNEGVPQTDLVKHLIIEHDIPAFDAGELAGLEMRKIWSNEEE